VIKAVTGQYEYIHRSGVGLDYFTSRIDRLTIQQHGRFVLIVQDRTRIAHAAQSLIKGQHVAPAAPETRRAGNYSVQGNIIALRFDDGVQTQGQLAWNGEGLQLGANFFTKVSASTLLPPPQRLKKDMDDIAKGLKIASTIGGMAMKAAKTLHDTIQTTQQPGAGPAQTVTPAQSSALPVSVQPGPAAQPQPAAQEALFCDQCGARARPGKRYCNNCGAQHP